MYVRQMNSSAASAKRMSSLCPACGATSYSKKRTGCASSSRLAKHVWRGMISDLTQREDELGGKTLLIIGLGGIGSRLAQLAKAFGMRVIGIKRDPSKGGEAADSVHRLADLR